MESGSVAQISGDAFKKFREKIKLILLKYGTAMSEDNEHLGLLYIGINNSVNFELYVELQKCPTLIKVSLIHTDKLQISWNGGSTLMIGSNDISEEAKVETIKLVAQMIDDKIMWCNLLKELLH